MTDSNGASEPTESRAAAASARRQRYGVAPPEAQPTPGEDAPPLETPSNRELARLQLDRIKPYLSAGAVFRVRDADTRRTPLEKFRPVVLIGPVPDLRGNPEVALARPIRVSTRLSEKPHHVRPLTDEQVRWLADNKGLLYTPKGFLRAFTKHGYFELGRRSLVTIGRLDPDLFLGWLPRPHVEILVMKMTGKPLSNPYPPPLP